MLNMEADQAINLNTSLFDELHLDSTSVLELLMTLEDRIDGLEIDPDELEPDVLIQWVHWLHTLRSSL